MDNNFVGIRGVCGHAQETDKVKTVNIAGIDQDVKESTASISLISGENLTKRSAKNVTNSLFGYGLGLTALQNSGSYSSQEPTLYIRGLQTLSSSTPLMLVDGIERDITLVTSEEVESVQILKDAAAVALYGYKGANGVINIITKRGKYNTKKLNLLLTTLLIGKSAVRNLRMLIRMQALLMRLMQMTVSVSHVITNMR